MQRFRTVEQGPNFDRARTQIATPFFYQDIDLTTALVNKIVPLWGDFLFADASSTGVASIEFNNQQDAPSAPFQVQAGFGIEVLFTQIKISAAAQPGKTLRLMYATGARIVPTNVMQISLNAAPRFSATNGAVNVTNADAEIVAANSARSYLMIQNNDAAGIVYVGFGAAAVTAANGFKIAPGGGYLEFNSNIPTDAVRAIGSIAANGNVIVIEG